MTMPLMSFIRRRTCHAYDSISQGQEAAVPTSIAAPAVQFNNACASLKTRIRVSNVLSTRGLLSALFVVICLAIWFPTRWHEFLACAIMLSCMLIVALISCIQTGSLRVDIPSPERSAVAGETIEMSLVITNVSRIRPTRCRLQLQVRDHTSTAQHIVDVPRIQRGTSRTVKVPLTPTARTVLHIGPASMSPSDPFGLCGKTRDLSETVNVHVHPFTTAVSLPRTGFIHDPQGLLCGDQVSDGLDFQSLREYQPGDDLRNVHWPSSAKSDVLMIRRYTAMRRVDTGLTLVSDADAYSDANEFEIAVAAYASLGVACIKAQRPLSVSAGGKVFRPIDMQSFLDTCSDLIYGDDRATGEQQHVPMQSSEDESIERSRLDQRICQMLVTGSRMHDERIAALTESSSHAAYHVVITVQQDKPCHVAMLPWYVLMTISSLQDLPTVMGALL